MNIKPSDRMTDRDVMVDGNLPFTIDDSDYDILESMPNILDEDWDAGPDTYTGDESTEQ